MRDLFDDTFSAETLLEVTGEMEDLAAAYLRQGVVPPKYADDATHVAVCTVARLQYLVSWNFQHLVNVRKRRPQPHRFGLASGSQLDWRSIDCVARGYGFYAAAGSSTAALRALAQACGVRSGICRLVARGSRVRMSRR